MMLSTQRRAALRRLSAGTLLACSLFTAHSFAALDPSLPPGGNFDLGNWNITIPFDAEDGTSGKPLTILPAKLAGPNGFSHVPAFFTDSDGAMTFWAPLNGATTGGSKHPRSELREMIDGVVSDKTARDDLKAAQAAAAKNAGTVVYTIGLNFDGIEASYPGAGVLARQVLQSMASSPTNYYESPTPSELNGIFAQIAQIITHVAATNVVVTDILPPGVHYVPGSAMPEPSSISGQTLIWNLGIIGITQTHTITFQVSSTVARNLMRSCASDPSKYFDSPDAATLTQTFRAIGSLMRLMTIQAQRARHERAEGVFVFGDEDSRHG